MEPLEVDGFEIDITILYSATNNRPVTDYARYVLTEKIIANLSQDSKKRFNDYQEQNNPCCNRSSLS